MKKVRYVELIDKYRVEQDTETDYNPPSYIWDDNTGRIVRCGDCRKWHKLSCPYGILDRDAPIADEYCSRGVAK